MRHLLLLPALCAFRVRGLRVYTCVSRSWRHAHTRARVRARERYARTSERTDVRIRAGERGGYECARNSFAYVVDEGRGAEGRGPTSSVHRRGGIHIVMRSAAVGMCTPLSRVTSDERRHRRVTAGETESTPPVTRTPLFTSDNVHPVEYLHIHYIPRALSNATLRIEIDRVDRLRRVKDPHTHVPRSRPRLRRRNSRSP